MKKLILILLLNVSFLFSPPPIPGTTMANGRYISINKYTGFFVNPDAYGFILPAIRPKQLMEYHQERQNRPLFVLTGSVIGYSISFLAIPFHKWILQLYERFWRGAYPEEMIIYIGNFYIGYVLLNVIILWTSLFLFERIFNLLVEREDASAFLMFLLMVFIASNPVTKAFFWTVHEQMFAFMTPLLCIYTLIRFSRLQNAVSFECLAGIFFTGGLLLLVYGNFILMIPTLIYGVLYQSKKFDKLKKGSIILLKLSLLILLFFIPTICWVGILKWNGIDYYNFEMNVYHHIVWIPETIHESFGSFIQQLYFNTVAYIKTMRLILILILISLVIFFSGKIKISWESDIIHGILFIFLYFFLFYWLLGAYFDRLTQTLIPIFVCFWVSAARQKLTSTKMIYIISGLSLCWHFFILTSYGPFY